MCFGRFEVKSVFLVYESFSPSRFRWNRKIGTTTSADFCEHEPSYLVCPAFQPKMLEVEWDATWEMCRSLLPGKSKIIPDPAYADKLKFLRFEHPDWIPTPCLTDEYHGDANSQGVWTLKWDSPSLLDKNWVYYSLDQWEYIQTLPVGAVLATRQHRYQFEGSVCSGFSWGPLNAEIWLEYVFRRVKNTDGTLQEPPKNVAEWRIISTPGPM